MKVQLYISVILMTVIAGCAGLKPAVMPAQMDLPESVNGDSGDLRPVFNQFFQDVKLKSLIDTALVNNFEIKQAMNRMQIARANTRVVSRGLYPNLTAIVSAGVDRFGKYTLDGVGNFDTNLSPNIDKDSRIPDPTGDFFLGFRSSWEIDIWGKLRDKKKAAYARYLASERGRQWLITQLVADVSQHYYTLLALDDQQEILARNILLQERGLELIESQMLGGRATALAVRQFKAQLLHSRGAAIAVRQAVTETENSLNNLLARLPGSVQRDSVFLGKQVPSIVDKGVPSDLLLRRPDIREAELELLASKMDVQAARKALFPSLSLEPYIGFNAFKLPLLISGSSLAPGVASALAAPLLNRGKLAGDIQMANASQYIAFYNYQNKILNAFHEVATELKAIENLQEAYDLKADEVKTLTDAVGSATDLYLAGYANYLEVVVAQESVLQAELEQIDIKKKIFYSLINLYRSVGGQTQ